MMPAPAPAAVQRSPNGFGKRYRLIAKLGAGGMGEVYQAQDRLVGQMVALKRVSSSYILREQDTTADRHSRLLSPHSKLGTIPAPLPWDLERLHLALVQEFRILASLRHPNIISVLDYGMDEKRRPYFTMELLEQPRTILEAGFGQPLKIQIDLLTQLLRALSYLHRRGILHRDLKPANVLCVGHEVKVVDFGIASSVSQVAKAAGTVGYMAPELLNGAPPSIESDLYAFGVIAFQMLTGRLSPDGANWENVQDELAATEVHARTIVQSMPFDTCADTQAPDFEVAPVLQEPLIPNGGPLLALGQVLKLLLAPRPSDRFSDAPSVLTALNLACGMDAPVETASTLDSCLHASPFVGRRFELAVLDEAMQRAFHGDGSGWLLGGESGVGKSRLLEELRTKALVDGALVLRGQETNSCRSAYGAWQGIVRALCLHLELEALEAGVLKFLVPDLEALLEQTIPEPPALDPESARLRLMMMIENAILRLPTTTVILLEDLQWAAPESLLLFERLVSSRAKQKLLLIGSFRDEECPNLPSQLVGMQHLKLQRFDSDNIATLCMAVLGTVGQQSAIVELLQHETEGNALFLIEVMRALIEESGSILRVGEMPLPRTLFAGGIKTVLSHRLNRVPQQARPLLQLAAVAGRELDLNLLKAIEPQLQSWLGPCADAAVLEVHEQRWRFSHDKIRESLLDELSPDEARRVHRQIAEALKLAYPEPSAPAVLLAYHYSQAGDGESAAPYSVQAGEEALRNGVLHDALQLLQQALEQQPKDTPRLTRARVQRNLIKVLVGLGRLAEAASVFEQAAMALGHDIPTAAASHFATALGQGLKQLRHRLLPRSVVPPADQQARQELAVSLDLFFEIVESYGWLGRQIELLHVALWSLNAAEVLNHQPYLAYFYPVVGYSLSIMRMNSASRFYLRKAESVLTRVRDKKSEASTRRIEGLLAMHAGQWELALQNFQLALPLARELGDELLTMFIITQYAGVAFYRGDYDEVQRHSEQLYVTAEHQRNHQYQIWSLAFLSAINVRRGQYAQAQGFLLEAVGTHRHRDALAEILVRGQLALCTLRLGDSERAEKLADAVLALIAGTALTGYGSLEGYGCIAAVYLHLWQKSANRAQRARAHEQLRRTLKLLDRYSGSIPLGAPSAYLLRGRYAELCHNPLRARYLFARSLHAARQQGMPYEEATAHAQLGSFYARQPPLPHFTLRSQEHRQAARTLFSRLGIPPEGDVKS